MDDMTAATFRTTPTHRRRCVTALTVIAACFVGAGIGTLKGSGPTWPANEWWAMFAFVAAASIVTYLLRPTYMTLCLMSCACMSTSGLRALGNLWVGQTPTAVWTGTAVWTALAVYHWRLHKDENRRHFA